MATAEQIAQRLTQPIPEPFVPPPKAQASWQRLKAGQRLALRDRYFHPAVGECDIGTVFEVVSTDSQGCVLRCLHGPLGASRNRHKPGGELRWEEKDWERVFRRSRSRSSSASAARGSLPTPASRAQPGSVTHSSAPSAERGTRS